RVQPTVQRVAAEEMKTQFGFDDVENRAGLRAKIGKEAFDRLRTATDDELNPLYSFFKNQPLPIQHANGQCDLLFPYSGEPGRLAVAKYALINTNYTPDQARPIIDYLLPHQAKGDASLQLAKTVLSEHGNDPVAAQLDLDQLNQKINKGSGREKFEKDYKEATGKDLTKTLVKGDVDTGFKREKYASLGTINYKPGTSNHTKQGNAELANKQREAKIEDWDKKEEAFRVLVEPLVLAKAGNDAIDWCLGQSQENPERLKTVTTLIRASISHGIAFDAFIGLLGSEELWLWDVLGEVTEEQVSELPSLFQKATFPKFRSIFDDTGSKFILTKDLLGLVLADQVGQLETIAKQWKSVNLPHLKTLITDFGLEDVKSLNKQGTDDELIQLFITDGLSVADTKTLLTKVNAKANVVSFLKKVPKPALLVSLENLTGSKEELERMVGQTSKDGTTTGLVEASVGVAGNAAQVAVRGTLNMRDSPSGKITPSGGPLDGVEQKYGDNRNKHTRLGLYTVGDIQGAVGPKLHNADYGSQLGKNATDNYGALVKDAIENGARQSDSEYRHTAGYDVGVNIHSGLATRNYTIFKADVYGGWHVFPN
ncbi:MAG TPA: hypothetical protein DCE41_38050, partial [Cytophagales bacterium]|nr:hypothetical protein [Cytophagales bacterium]